MDHVRFGKQLKHYVDPPTRPTDEELNSFGSDLKDVIKTKLRTLNGHDYYLTRRNEARLGRIQKLTQHESPEEWFCLEHAAAEFEEHFYIYRWQRYWLAILDNLDPQKITSHVTQTLDIEGAKQFPIEQLFPNQLRQYGGRYSGLCPFHLERTPSFFIFSDNHFYCYGCNEKGDSIDFLMKLKGYDFKEAVRSLT